MSEPYACVISGLEGPVLIVLSGTMRPLTGRQVQRLAPRGSVRGIGLALDRLVDQGLVRAEPAGRAVLYTANRAHLAWSAVETLLSLREQFFGRLSHRLTRWSPAPRGAVVFGSAARGDGGIDSDIDLLLVRPDAADAEVWSESTDRLREEVMSWTGNRLQVVEVTETRWEQMRETGDPLADSIVRDGVDLLHGAVRA